MKNLLKIGIFLLYCGSTTLAIAQPNEGKRGEKVEALRVAFLTERLQLSAKEAQTFWPVYNEFQSKVRDVRAAGKDDKLGDNANDADIERAITAHFDAEQRALNLQKEYYGELKKVLSLRKVMRLHRAEREFKNRLLDHLRNNNDDTPPPPQQMARPRRLR